MGSAVGGETREDIIETQNGVRRKDVLFDLSRSGAQKKKKTDQTPT